jgi:hypothetical protein
MDETSEPILAQYLNIKISLKKASIYHEDRDFSMQIEANLIGI